jgi:hypothetical protein
LGRVAAHQAGEPAEIGQRRAACLLDRGNRLLCLAYGVRVACRWVHQLPGPGGLQGDGGDGIRQQLSAAIEAQF